MADLWIVYCSCGEYSDRQEWAVAVVDCEDDATLYVTTLQQRYLSIPPALLEDRWDHEDEIKEIMSIDPGFQTDYAGTSYFCGKAPHLTRLDLERAVEASRAAVGKAQEP